MSPESVLPAPFADRIAYKVRRQGCPFVSRDDVQEVFGGGSLIDKKAEQTIRNELRLMYGIWTTSDD
jgi:hypothetical protein